MTPMADPLWLVQAVLSFCEGNQPSRAHICTRSTVNKRPSGSLAWEMVTEHAAGLLEELHGVPDKAGD